MLGITQYFNRIIAKQKEMGYYFPKILNAPANLSQIRETEEKLQLKFNDELTELYLFADGTNFHNVTPTTLTWLFPPYNFVSLADASSYFKITMDLNIDSIKELEFDCFYNEEENFSPGRNLFPFLIDSGSCYWVDLNENSNSYGNIFETNSIGENPNYTFSSLTTFFQTICECYESEIICIEQNGFLSCNYHRFGETAQKINPNLNYWIKHLNN